MITLLAIIPILESKTIIRLKLQNRHDETVMAEKDFFHLSY